MRAHFDFGLTVQNRGSAYLHEIYDCERRNVRYDIFDQGLSCGRTKNQPKSTYKGFTIVNLMHFEQLLPLNRYGHATPRGSGSGVRGPGRWAAATRREDQNRTSPGIKKGAPRKGSFWTKWNRQGDDGSCKTSRKEGYRSTGAEYTVLFILCQE